MKAYRGEDGRLRLFRPDRNMARMLKTAARSSLPTFEAEEMIKCLKRLIQIDKDWIPKSTSSSLYIRPTFIATDVTATDKSCSQIFVLNLYIFCYSLALVSQVPMKLYSMPFFLQLVLILVLVLNLFPYLLIHNMFALGLEDVVPWKWALTMPQLFTFK